MEYGPVSADQVRQWIAEGRVNAETKLQAEGTAEWKPLAEVPELAAPRPATAPTACPTCGEPFESNFDSCWKCGTRKDGSRPKDWTPVADGAAETLEPCPKCGGVNVTPGKLLPSRHSISATFRPAGARLLGLSLTNGVDLCTDPGFACQDCGLVWSYLRPEELKAFISRHCARSDQHEAYALLAEGARLDSKGDTAGALATYEAVMAKSAGTPAAKDAECSIRNLKDKMG